MKARILIVDDEEMFVQSLADRLNLRDYDVTTSLNGEDAIEQVKHYLCEVVILDVAMPGISGIDTLREIKRIKPLTEVIMLTGHATVESAIEGLKLGAMDIIAKPCETEDLTLKINKAYDKKAKHDERIRQAQVEGIIASPRSVLN